jgi:hypothetical protein
MKSQSVGLVLLVVGFLVPSCSQQNTSTQTASQPSTNSQPIPQKTFTPVTGAFGWKLGESLHSTKYEIKTHKWMMMVSYDAQQDSTILPFESVNVCATKEGIIYGITAYIRPDQEAYSNVREGIVKALAEKYQEILSGYEFGDKTNSVTLLDQGYPLGLQLVYKHALLSHAVVSEQIRIQNEEKTRQEQTIKDSLKGL